MKKAFSHNPISMSMLRWKRAVYLCFVLLFTLSYGMQLLSSTSINLQESIQDSYSEHKTYDALNFPFSLPGMPESTEDGDEDNRVDSFEDDIVTGYAQCRILSNFSPIDNCSIIQFQRKVENISFPSLYIIYQTWKSFLD